MISPFKRAGLVAGFLVALLGVFLAAAILAPSARAQSGTPHWLVELKDGVVEIELLTEVAPLHAARIVELTEAGFYDGIVFHRVIDGFMAQSGDPTGTGRGGSELPNVPAEFSQVSHVRGAVGAARTNDPNSFNSQFFICFDDCSFLDGQYTVFGQVLSGMELVDNITRGEPPANPDRIVSAKIEYR